jgi:predicted phosphodiesterase
MNLLIISDLHINSKKCTNIFQWKSYDFIEQIEKIRKTENISKIILNGDIYELYQSTFEEIKQSNSFLVKYLTSDVFYYIKGNHDGINNFGNKNFIYTNSVGKTIYIEHGHEADYLSGTKLGRFAGNLFYKLLKRIIKYQKIKKIFNEVVEYNDQVNRIPRKYDRYKYLTYAMKLLKKYDLVILGHTHKLEEHKTFYINNKKTYLNCGSCTLSRFQGIVIDTETLKHKIIKKSSLKIKTKKTKSKIKKNEIKTSEICSEQVFYNN